MGYKRGKRVDMTAKEVALARIYDRVRKRRFVNGKPWNRWSPWSRGFMEALDMVAEDEDIIGLRPADYDQWF